MTTSIIKRLNQLNKEFYKTTAKDFSQTRQQPWPGWHQLLPHIKNLTTTSQELTTIDLACGNGRFFAFLEKHLPDLHFTHCGLDTSQYLLDKASKLPFETNLKKLDIIESLINNSLVKTINPLINKNPTLITLFGILHHIPSFKLRQQLFKNLFSLMPSKSLLVVTTWQFPNSKRLMKRSLHPIKVGFEKEDLEPNDYFLDWQRGPNAVRYCHHVDDAELAELLKLGNHQLETKITTPKSISLGLDSKKNNLNTYLILRKK